MSKKKEILPERIRKERTSSLNTLVMQKTKSLKIYKTYVRYSLEEKISRQKNFRAIGLALSLIYRYYVDFVQMESQQSIAHVFDDLDNKLDLEIDRSYSS